MEISEPKSRVLIVTPQINYCNHQLYVKKCEMEYLNQCINSLKNEEYSTDSMKQSPEKILANFGISTTVNETV